MSNVLRETPPITDKDCFYIVERHKSVFNYPIHSHEEFELNFVEHCHGVHRVVGDSIEEVGDYDLVLVTGDGLEHAWPQGNCTSPDVREITIQFYSGLGVLEGGYSYYGPSEYGKKFPDAGWYDEDNDELADYTFAPGEGFLLFGGQAGYLRFPEL